MSSSSAPESRPALYPYEFAIINLIFLLLAAGAILQADALALRPKLTSTFALVAVAGVHLWKTKKSGYLPGAATNPRVAGTPNVPGRFTLVVVALDIVAIVGVLTS